MLRIVAPRTKPPHPSSAPRAPIVVGATDRRRGFVSAQPDEERSWWRQHGIAIGLLAATALWLMRHLVFSHAIPAGTDMLDLLARTRANASWNALISPWAPTGFGLPRQVSLDNLLGLITMATGSAVVTVKIALCAVLLGSGLSVYWLVWKWYRAVFASTIAAMLAMTSQAVLGRIASGWLHYEILIALSPVVLYLWVSLIDRFRLRSALLLALVIDAIVLARPDLILWVLPFLGLYVIVHSATVGVTDTLRNLLKAVGVLIPALLVLTSYLWIPFLAGIHAPWLSGSDLFQQIRFNLIDRSLTAYQSVLGLGRDMGYLPFNGQEWWTFHPYLSTPAYYGAQGLLVVAAYLAIRVSRSRHTMFLAACAVVAPFLGKGIRGPIGGPYWWTVQHVPVFGNLRGPNRWLIVGSIAYAVLAAIALNGLTVWLRTRLRTDGRISPGFGYIPAVALATAMLLPVAPTLATGFLAWQPTSGQLGLMQLVERDHSDFTVASIPYDQSQEFVSLPGYSGWEHDLGVESPLWTDHPAISTNGWSRAESDFVDYTESLLRARDPAFGGLLAGAGVRDVIAFDTPPSADYLTDGTDPLYQQRAIQQMDGFVPVGANAAGTVYQLPAAAPVVSFRPNIGIALGGRDALAAFDDLPGVTPARWAIFTAEDLLTGPGGSFDRLLRYMRTANLVLASNDSTQDLSVLGTQPVVQVPGVTSDPGLDRKDGLLLTDESARRGNLADQAIAPPALVHETTTSFTLNGTRRLELWARVLYSEQPGSLRFSIDGRTVKTIVPLAPGSGAFRWIHLSTPILKPGHHEIEIDGRASDYGTTFEVDEARLIDPALRAEHLAALEQALSADRNKLAYSVSASAAGSELPSTGVTGGYQLDDETSHFWQPTSTEGMSSSSRKGSAGQFERFRLNGDRPYYTVAEHAFASPQTWAARDSLVLHYRGTGDGAPYEFLVDFNRARTQFVSFPFVDDRPGWHTAVFRLQRHVGRWSHIVSVRIASKSKTQVGQLDVGPVKRLFPDSIVVHRDVGSAMLQQPRVMGGSGATDVQLSATSGSSTGQVLSFTAPGVAPSERVRVVALPSGGIHEEHSVPIDVGTSGGTRYPVSFDAPERGALVLDKAFDPHWRLSADGREIPPAARVGSLATAFLVDKGQRLGVVDFAGSGIFHVAALTGLLAALALAVGLAIARLRRGGQDVAQYQPVIDFTGLDVPRDSRPKVWTIVAVVLAIGVVGPSSFLFGAAILIAVAIITRASWLMPLRLSIVLLALAPLCIAKGYGDFADVLALDAVLLLAMSLVLLIVQQRSSRHRRLAEGERPASARSRTTRSGTRTRSRS